jgi:hypothetical protein
MHVLLHSLQRLLGGGGGAQLEALQQEVLLAARFSRCERLVQVSPPLPPAVFLESPSCTAPAWVDAAPLTHNNSSYHDSRQAAARAHRAFTRGRRRLQRAA